MVIATALFISLSFAPANLLAQDSLSRATLELFSGAEENDLEKVKRAIYAGGDVMARNASGQRTHDVAVDLNHMDIAHYILSMRPKTTKRYVAPVVSTPAVRPAKPNPLPPPVKPIATSHSATVPVKKVARKPDPAAPVVVPISKSGSAEISRKTASLQPTSTPRITSKPVNVAAKQPKPVKPVKTAAAPSRPFNFFGNHIPQRENGKLPCIDKADNVKVCLMDLNWPPALKNWFDVDTVYYDGSKALVMYQNNELKQIHVLFRREGFEPIRKFLSGLLDRAGQSSSLERTESSETWLGKSTGTVAWQGLKGSWPDSLEIRELDSLRWSAMPDENHGVVRVFRQGDDPVFKHVSSADFMLGFLSTAKKGKK